MFGQRLESSSNETNVSKVSNHIKLMLLFFFFYASALVEWLRGIEQAASWDQRGADLHLVERRRRLSHRRGIYKETKKSSRTIIQDETAFLVRNIRWRIERWLGLWRCYSSCNTNRSSHAYAHPRDTLTCWLSDKSNSGYRTVKKITSGKHRLISLIAYFWLVYLVSKSTPFIRRNLHSSQWTSAEISRANWIEASRWIDAHRLFDPSDQIEWTLRLLIAESRSQSNSHGELRFRAIPLLCHCFVRRRTKRHFVRPWIGIWIALHPSITSKLFCLSSPMQHSDVIWENQRIDTWPVV